MKKTLFILATMVAAAVAAEASTVLISFGINSGNGTAVVDGTYLGEPGQKVNKISTGQSNSILPEPWSLRGEEAPESP